MTKNAYTNDPRVQVVVADAYYRVDSDDVYDVSARNNGDWWVALSLDSRTMAGVDSRAEGDDILRASRRGPFSTADEALYALIGDPR
jgi:hypothetical protein